MSDFLKRFSNQEYDDEKQEIKISDVVKSDIISTTNIKEETFVKDDSFARKQKIKLGIIVGLIITVIVVGFFINSSMNSVTMKQFAKEKTIEEMQAWAIQNKIDLNIDYKYSLEAESSIVLEQSVPQKKTIKKGSDVDVMVSKGADPEEKIKLPDFMVMKGNQIEEWKEKTKASNISIVREYHDEKAKEEVLHVSFKDQNVTAETYRRKDKVTIKVSKGKEVFEKDISMPNFKDKTKAEVETWAQKEEVEVSFTEQESKSVEKGMILSQSIPAKEKIAKKDKLTIVVSVGRILYAPNFYGMNETQAQSAAGSAGVSVQILYYHHGSIATNQLISQTTPAGNRVEESDTGIVLTYSLGKPYIMNYADQPEITMIEAINEMNKKGANLTYVVQYVRNEDIMKGNVISSSPMGSFVEVGSTIHITVSSGR